MKHDAIQKIILLFLTVVPFNMALSQTPFPSTATLKVKLLSKPTGHNCLGTIRFEYNTCNCFEGYGIDVSVNGNPYATFVKCYDSTGPGISDKPFAPGEYDIIGTVNSGAACSNTGQQFTFHISIKNPPCQPALADISDVIPATGYGCNDGSVTAHVHPVACGGDAGRLQILDTAGHLIREHIGIWFETDPYSYTFGNMLPGEYVLKAWTNSSCADTVYKQFGIPGPACETSVSASYDSSLNGQGCLTRSVKLSYGDGYDAVSCTGPGPQNWIGGIVNDQNQVALSGSAKYGDPIVFSNVASGYYIVSGSRGVPCKNNMSSITVPGNQCSSALVEIKRIDSTAGIFCPDAIKVELSFSSSACYTQWNLFETNTQILGGEGSWSAAKGQTIIASVPAPKNSSDVYHFLAFSDGDPLQTCPAKYEPSGFSSKGCDGTLSNYLKNPVSQAGASDAAFEFKLSTSSCANTPWTVYLKNQSTKQVYAGAGQDNSDSAIVIDLPEGTYKVSYVYAGNICQVDNAGTVTVPACQPTTFYRDYDGDGFGDPNNSIVYCLTTPPSGYSKNSKDSNDSTLTYADIDGDGHGSGAPKPKGVTNNDDFNDSCATCYPNAPEVCDGFDNNGDGYVDRIYSTGTLCDVATEGSNVILTAPAGGVFTSVDFASYGTPDGTCGNFTYGSCNAPTSQLIVESYLLGKNNASIPANNNVFGSLCSGVQKRLYVQATYTVDIDIRSTFYRDADGDGWGNALSITKACNLPQGYVVNPDDCNDDPLTGSNIHPGAPEVCNGVDDNCDGLVDINVLDGLKLYLPFTGSPADSSGNHHDATIVNAMLTTDQNNISNRAYNFNGTDAKIEVADNADIEPQSLSLSCWAYYSSIPSGIQSIIGKGYCSGWSDSYSFWFQNGQLHAGLGYGSFGLDDRAFAAPTPNQWHHLALTFDNATHLFNVYIDNVLSGSYNASYNLMYENSPLIIGADWDQCGYNYFYSGKVDEVMLFNRAITASEVDKIYHSNPYLPITTEICNGIDDDCDGWIDETCTPTASIVQTVAQNEGNSGQSNMRFTVTLNHPYETDVTIKYKTRDRTANSGVDYVSTTGRLTFHPGEISKRITVLINGDVTAEPNETFQLILTSAENAILGNATAMGRILNDDGAAKQTISISQTNKKIQAGSITLYPNPANNTITLEGTKAGSSIEIVNILGKILIQQKATSIHTTINISKLPAGSYAVKLLDGNMIRAIKFIKQ